jgi:hypothetical protein
MLVVALAYPVKIYFVGLRRRCGGVSSADASDEPGEEAPLHAEADIPWRPSTPVGVIESSPQEA